jgi:hypothetical protein
MCCRWHSRSNSHWDKWHPGHEQRSARRMKSQRRCRNSCCCCKLGWVGSILSCSSIRWADRERRERTFWSRTIGGSEFPKDQSPGYSKWRWEDVERLVEHSKLRNITDLRIHDKGGSIQSEWRSSGRDFRRSSGERSREWRYRSSVALARRRQSEWNIHEVLRTLIQWSPKLLSKWYPTSSVKPCLNTAEPLSRFRLVLGPSRGSQSVSPTNFHS